MQLACSFKISADRAINVMYDELETLFVQILTLRVDVVGLSPKDAATMADRS
jgi:hypothetical protein